MEVKLKKCKNQKCGREFKPFSSFQPCCSMKCTNEHQKAKQEARDAAKKAKGKSERSQVLEVAQMVFNGYIRARDRGKPCICCGRPLGKDYHAGHYFSMGGHSAVRFDEDNVHAQRSECNTADAGNNVEYGVRLEKLIGRERFEVLRANAYETKRWEVDELRRLIERYKRETAKLNSK